MLDIFCADYSTGLGGCQYLFVGMVKLIHSCIMALLTEATEVLKMARFKITVKLENSTILYSEDLAEFEVSEHVECAKLDYPRDAVVFVEVDKNA